MEQTMNMWITTMLYSGCICTLLLYLCPNGAGKAILTVGCTCVMLLSFLSPILEFKLLSDRIGFDRLSERLAAQNAEFALDADTLQKQIIEQEYESYLLNAAECQGISLSAVEIHSEQCEGAWLPCEVVLHCYGEIPMSFHEFVTEEFGIDFERQHTYEVQSGDQASS